MAKLYVRMNSILNPAEADYALRHQVCLHDDLPIAAAIRIANSFNDALTLENPEQAWMWAQPQESGDIDEFDRFGIL